MRKATAELILKDPDRFAHHDRVFLNNPVVMQGMGLAPLVVLATTAHNGVMLAAAVTLLLVPSRVLACLLSRLFPLNSENPTPEELQKKLLPRALVYSLGASVVYLAAYPILNAMFGTSLLTLGIYLPLLVVEPRVEQHLYNGCPTSRYPAADGRYRVRSAGGQFLGLAKITGGVLKVEKLFVERNEKD